MSSLEIYLDTKQPELVAALIDYYTGSIDVELYPASGDEIEKQSSVDIIPNGTWFNWTPCVDARATLDDEDYANAIRALSKIKHLLTQFVEGDTTSDRYWPVGNSDVEVERLINAPLEYIDTAVENQLQAKLESINKLKKEVDELYRTNLEINQSWKGWVLKLFGINLPDKKDIWLMGVDSNNKSLYQHQSTIGKTSDGLSDSTK